MNYSNILLTVLTILPALVWGQPTAVDEETMAEINNYFNKQDRQDHGGAVLAMIKEGKVVFQRAYGMANLEYGIPNEANTVFHAASLSKQFTAYAALILEQEGKLSMEDDVRKYVPEMPDFGHVIRLRHLANHTSGLRDQWRMLYLAGWRPDDVILNQDILNLVVRQEALNFVPGTKVMYSNTGFTLLAEVVARVSGMTFAEFTAKRIFAPLGMINSQFYDDYQKVVPNRAYSYQEKDERVKKNRLNFATVGATSLFTTVPDLTKWVLHLNNLDDTAPKLAKAMSQQAKLNNGKITESANGQWGGVKFHGMEWFDHTGSDASYRAYLARFPESNSGVIILANATPIEARGTAMGVAEIFLSDFFREEIKDEKMDIKAAIARREATYTPVQLSIAELQKFCGKYWETEERYDRQIKIVKDTLVYYRRESSQTKLLPVGSNEFKMLGDDNDVSVFFETNERGEATMRLDINGDRTVQFVKYASDVNLEDITGKFVSQELGSTLVIKVENGTAYLEAPKRASLELNLIKQDLFKASDRVFSKLEFVRNSAGQVSHLLVSNGGVLNVRFSKR